MACSATDGELALPATISGIFFFVSAGDYDFAKKQVDKGLPDGPFSGVPFLLKDLDLLQGTVTTFGASVYHNNVGDHSGTLARRFLDTGVAIFGKAQAPNSG